MENLEPPGVAIDGRQVRQKRKLIGKNARDFAIECGISPGYISHIEVGRRPTVSPRVFAAICDVLGVEDRRELLSGQGRVA